MKKSTRMILIVAASILVIFAIYNLFFHLESFITTPSSDSDRARLAHGSSDSNRPRPTQSSSDSDRARLAHGSSDSNRPRPTQSSSDSDRPRPTQSSSDSDTPGTQTDYQSGETGIVNTIVNSISSITSSLFGN
jgi:cytoskeletal protein RodZ